MLPRSCFVNSDWGSDHDFTKMLADVFLYQVIDLPSRKKNILKFVLSFNPDNIKNITVDSTFGLSSDHYCVYFDLYLNFKLINSAVKKTFDYENCDFNSLRASLNDNPLFVLLTLLHSMDFLRYHVCNQKEKDLLVSGLSDPKVLEAFRIKTGYVPAKKHTLTVLLLKFSTIPDRSGLSSNRNLIVALFLTLSISMIILKLLVIKKINFHRSLFLLTTGSSYFAPDFGFTSS